jgi:hypothetical protein
VVRHMWGVYTQSKSMRLPKFWQEAFEAAYEHLTSDVLGVRDAAVSEIAKMSMRSISLDPLPSHSQVGSSSSHFSCCLCIYIYIFFFTYCRNWALLLAVFFTFRGERPSKI